MGLRLDAAADFVSALAAGAAKEAAVEAGLAAIAATWAGLQLDMVEYKVRGRNLSGTHCSAYMLRHDCACICRARVQGSCS